MSKSRFMEIFEASKNDNSEQDFLERTKMTRDQVSERIAYLFFTPILNDEEWKAFGFTKIKKKLTYDGNCFTIKSFTNGEVSHIYSDINSAKEHGGTVYISKDYKDFSNLESDAIFHKDILTLNKKIKKMIKDGSGEYMFDSKNYIK